MNNNITAFAKLLEARYPDVKCGLEAGQNAYKLLVMSILSAQCTDKRVNLVSVPLFERYPDIQAMAECDVAELEGYIKSCGLYHSKAKNIKSCCKAIVNDHNGVIPSEMDELLKLAGVGRKIANLLRGDIFGLGGIVADTHMIRIANRLGFADSDNAYKVELALSSDIPRNEQSAFCHRAVHFGREVCSARNPSCTDCFVRKAGICKGCSDCKNITAE